MVEGPLKNSPAYSGSPRQYSFGDKLAIQIEGTYAGVFNKRADFLNTDEEPPEEQGQEVLWVENAADPSTPQSKSGTTRTKLPSSQKIAQIIADGSKSHVIVFTEPIELLVPKEPLVKMKDNAVNSESRLLITAEKVAAAKQLLEQALNEKSATRSKDLANNAFSLALEARNTAELPTNTSEELTTVLNDASTKGKAEVLKVQELKHQSISDISRGKGENHASRARSLMDFILPENKVATPKVSSVGYKLLSHTELETTNSSDATFTCTAGPKDFDVFSMTSLNAILDDPEEESATTTLAQTRKTSPRERESRTVKSRIISTEYQDDATTNANEESADVKEESTASEKTSDGRNDDDGRKNSSRKSGLFGGLFFAKKSTKDKKQTQNRISETVSASVLTGNATSRPEELDGDAVDFDEKLLAKVAVIDQRVQKKLHNAIVNDETESITSLQNVKIHFIQDSSANRAHLNQEQITPERLAPHRKTAVSVQPLLVAAPKIQHNLHPCIKGDISPHMESFSLSIAGKKPILKKQKGKEKQGQNKKISTLPQKEEMDCDSGSKANSPSSHSSCDRYAVLPRDDRYDTIASSDSFRAFLQGRDSKNVISLPALDTVSTLGTRSSSDHSPVSQRVQSHADKYEPEFILEDSDNFPTSVLETPPQGGLRILGTTAMPYEVLKRAASATARRSLAKETLKPKNGTSAKKLKRKSLAGILGINGTNAFSKSKQVPSTHMSASLLRKSEQSAIINSSQIKNAEQVLRYAPPSVRIHVLPNMESEIGNAPTIQFDNHTMAVMPHNDHANSYSPGPQFDSFSKTGQSQKVSLTYSEPLKDFDRGLDKPTETDSTLSLCEESIPETARDEAESIRSVHDDATDEDPLVAHLKKQIIRQPKRGLDPTSAKASSRSYRLDP